MKLKQTLLVAVLLIALLAAWLSAASAAANKEAIEAQNLAVNTGDQYAEKELWVRAIPKYKEALTYKTTDEKAHAIEERLLNAYLSYGNTDSYLDLAQRRMDSGYATEDEYIRMAEIYFASGSLDEGITAAKNGIKIYDSQTCRELYEANRYTYTMKSTVYAEILPTKNNDVMPAYTGEGWTFVNTRGRATLSEEVLFDAVTNTNSTGYAVVTMEGVNYVITAAGDRYSIDENALTSFCGLGNSRILAEKDGKWGLYNADFNPISDTAYEALTLPDNGLLAAKKDGKWGAITEGGESIVAFQFTDAAVNSWGAAFVSNQACVQYDGKWYLINEKSEKLWQTPFSGAKAPESADGYIAVSNDAGLWGFADRAGNLVIDYQYDDAKSFSDHLAAVLVGDEWVYISESNEVIIDNVFYEAQPFHNGIAQVTLPDGVALLTLKTPNA